MRSLISGFHVLISSATQWFALFRNLMVNVEIPNSFSISLRIKKSNFLKWNNTRSLVLNRVWLQRGLDLSLFDTLTVGWWLHVLCLERRNINIFISTSDFWTLDIRVSIIKCSLKRIARNAKTLYGLHSLTKTKGPAWLKKYLMDEQ